MSKSNFTANPRKLSELSRVKEPLNENLTKNEEPSQKLLLRKTQRPESSNLVYLGEEKAEIGMNNGRWSNLEHRGFIDGIFKYSNDWKKITEDIKTRNCPQARSHSQKFFGKLNKYITKSNANYYVDLKKIFYYGKQFSQEKKDAVIEMLFLAHDHLDNVLNCEVLNHHMLGDFLETVKKSKLPKDNDLKFANDKDGNFNKNEDDCVQLQDEFNNWKGEDERYLNINKKCSEKTQQKKRFKRGKSDKNIINNNNSNKNLNLRSQTNFIVDGKNSINNCGDLNYSNVIGNQSISNNNYCNNYLSNASFILSNNDNHTSGNYRPNINYNNNGTFYTNDYKGINHIYIPNYLKHYNNQNNIYNQFFQEHKNQQNLKHEIISKSKINPIEQEQTKLFNALKTSEIKTNNCENTISFNNNQPEPLKFSYYNPKKYSFTQDSESDEYEDNTPSGSFKKNSTKADLRSSHHNTNSNSNGNFYENESQINFNNLNLTTLKDSTEEAKTRTDRRVGSRNTEKAWFRESSVNPDFVVPQPIKNNISNLIQINSEFAKTFSQEIEKDNFFKKHSLEVKNDPYSPKSQSYSNALNSPKNNINVNNNNSNNFNNQNRSKTEENYVYDDNPMGKISAYDYNNFYFNRCLEYLKKNSHRGKTDLIQEIKKCFTFPKKLLIESNNCNCLKCMTQNSDKTPEHNNESYPERDKKCINNQFYYCEFDDISFISNHENHCYTKLKKDSNFDSQNIE